MTVNKINPDDKPKKRRWRVSRRKFLIGTGATLGVLAIGGKLALDRGRMFLAEFEGGEFGTPPSDPDLWLELSPDNTITLYSPKGEFGQGIHTTLAQIAAEELEADWNQMRVAQADTQHGFETFAMFTLGSISTSSMYQPIREAAATLREMLRLQAAKTWNVDASLVFAMKGAMVRQDDPAQKLSYGDIAASTTTWEVPAEKAVLKSVSEFHTIGQAKQRVDLRDKVLGKAIYGYDARLEGMLYGAVARPPRYGATLKTVNASKAETLPGVVQIVQDKNFAGVVAESRPQAWQAVQALETQWEGGITWNDDDVRNAVTVPERGGTVLRRDGNVRSRLRGDVIEAEYRTTLAAHAHLEPQAALVYVQGDKAEAWMSTQTPDSEDIAKATGLEPKNITIYPRYMGGAFGRKFGNDVGVEAAKLSQAVGKPVHVGWNRLEEMRYGFFRPPTHTTFRAALEDGRIVALEQHTASGDVLFGMGGFPVIAENLIGFDFGAASSILPDYAIPNQRVLFHRVNLPVPTGSWRSLGSFPNAFARESFMDELAERAGVDPLEFRLRHLPESELGQRMRRVLETVAERSGWTIPVAEGTARGLAYGKYGKTLVAQVAEVAVENNQIQVKRFFSAVDCGLVINPDGALAQAQGSIVMGLSATLLEKITLKDGLAEADNFNQYPLLTLAQTPVIDVSFVGDALEPYGMGEPVIVPVAAAVANAVYALTGQRLRELPLTLEMG